ncbi:MAG: 4'-phosphopantetheinyl transferase superfamily protein [Clostridia bacterium]|nr:4'-phosphopantetheinyl transferase superfamily protein [Clostridia bacterium]
MKWLCVAESAALGLRFVTIGRNMDIQILTADVDELRDPSLYLRLYESVSRERREKVNRMRFPKDKRLSLGAGALLEAALSGLGIHDFAFSYGKYQKPRLTNTDCIQFNLSHSGTKVMCAISDSDIGCDVEKVTDIGIEIAEQFFFSEEYRSLCSCGEGESRNELFFRYWTLKESFMKATGLGFMLPPDAFCVLLEEGKTSVRHSVDERQYFFKEFHQGDEYRYAVCSVGRAVRDREGLSVKPFQWVLETLDCGQGRQ